MTIQAAKASFRSSEMAVPVARELRLGLTDKQRARFSVHFTHLDVDNNGFFEWDDIIAARRQLSGVLGLQFEDPVVQAQLTASRAWFDALLAAFDSNKDGKISLDEWLDGYASVSKAPDFESFSPLFKDQTNGLLRWVDKNGDGQISLAEYGAYYKLYIPAATDDEIKAQYAVLGRGKAAPTLDDARFVYWEWITHPDDPKLSSSLPNLEKHRVKA